MALHFPLMVNGDQIGRFVAQRREQVVPADRVCTYDVTVELHDDARTAVVRHNYDAGAFGLVAAGLAAVGLGPAGGREPSMPVFTILAKDRLAIRAVEAYRRLCLEVGLDEQARQVELAIGEMHRWRETHWQQVLLPDHTHVPASGDPG